MSLKLGNTNINKIYLGSNEISKAYLGSDMVYGDPSPYLTDLIAYYRLNETSGTDVFDVTGNYNGVRYGATMNETGQVGTAYSFDGVDDYIDLIGDLGITSLPVAFKAWVKFPTAPGSGQEVIVYEISSSRNRAFSVTVTSSTVYVTYGDNTGTSSGGRRTYNTNQGISDTGWHQIFVNMIDFNTVEVWIDGVETTVSYHSGGATSVVFTSSQFGLAYHPAGIYYDMTLDEVGFWAKTFSQSEIEDIYDKESNGISII